MPHALVIRVRFHDGRYHGAGDWPPSPARLFEALIAAAGLNGQLAAVRESLVWLEQLRLPPLIGAPNARRGQRVMFYMPNNDLDAVQGDPQRAAKIRTAKKFFSPWLFDTATPCLYIWRGVAAADAVHAQAVISLADRLYQFGRGLDMAWAWGELIDSPAVDHLVASYDGRIYCPSDGGGGITLPCPQVGSLASTERRHLAFRRRFEVERKGNTVKVTFRQPPRPRFHSVAYDSPPSRFVYELRASSGESLLAAWPLVDVSKLVVRLRDAAVVRLKAALPTHTALIERVLVGRKPDGANDGPPRERVRIVPLPSIGHPHADRAIRRILVEVPAGCSLRADDIAWAFSGLEPLDADTGEVNPVVLTPSLSGDMLRHYGIEEGKARIWRTITPVALPGVVGRRWSDPARKRSETKGCVERLKEQQRAAVSVIQALRHADVRARVESIHIQREPFDGRGDRAEAFATGTRFPKQRLWHVGIRFAEPVAGPVVVGDGRFLGLGVMSPLRTVQGVHAFVVEAGLVERPEPMEVARALRRAVMARVREELGLSRGLSPFFCGHEPDGAPASSERHPHLAFLFDAREARLLVVAPHLIDRRAATRNEQADLEILDRALQGFRELRAGAAGALTVRAAAVDPTTDDLFASARHWQSVTPYRVTRHARGGSAKEALTIDLCAECRRRGLPEPRVTVTEVRGISGIGLEGRVRLGFSVVVQGPLLLGRSCYGGGGLFRGADGRQG